MKTRMLLLALLVFSIATSVQAGWSEFCHRSMLDWHRNNAWPQPFMDTDRVAVCSPFVVMVQKGWLQQCTLSSHHFDPATHQLTEAGRLKVRHITTQHPEGFNDVYVVMGLDKEISSIRLDSVQRSVTQWVPEGSLPEVKLVSADPPSMPASEIAILSQRREATIPDPRLPEFQETTD